MYVCVFVCVQAEETEELFPRNLTWLTFWLPVPDDGGFAM